MSNRKSAGGGVASSVKKRDRSFAPDEDSNSKSKDEKTEQFQAEHELFIQAFEKPTQIYRALRTRSLISPVFLHRTLTFMKNSRSNRNNASRKNFRVDSLLERVEKKIKESGPRKGEFLTLTFFGYYEKKSATCPEGSLPVELLLVKPIYNRRKESFTQESIGIVDVPCNPQEDHPPAKSPVLAIPSDALSPLNGHQVQQSLLFRVVRPEKEVVTASDQPTDENTEPSVKRRKASPVQDENSDENSTSNSGSVSSGPAALCSILQVYNQNFRCLLEEGDYSSVLMKTDMKSFSSNASSSSTAASSASSIGKKRSWESPIDLDQKLELNENLPYLKFRLAWTSEAPSSTMVDRPRPLMPRGLNHQMNGGSGLTQINGNDVNKKDKKSKHSDSISNKKEPTRIIFQFLYNNNTRQQTETRDDFHCPWCAINCKELYPLLKHLKLSHPRFLFTYVPMVEGARIDVTVSELYDSTYVGNPHDLISQPPGAAFSRFGPVQRTSITHILVCKPKRTKPSLSEFLEIEDNDLNGPYDGQRPFVTGHNRLYHYSTTSLPMPPHAILHASSEDVVDPSWLTTTMCRMIDEFSDVNEGEKEFMKMWNIHVQHYTFVGDCQIPLAIKMFIEERGKEMVEKNLYRNFLLHLTNLFEFGVLAPGAVLSAILQFQSFIADSNLSLKLRWREQLQKWRELKQNSTSGSEPHSRKDFSGIFAAESSKT